MPQICFEKVKFETFRKYIPCNGLQDSVYKEIYNSIKFPQRATKGSAGYDFFSPFPITLQAKKEIVIPTGIKVLMPEDTVLMVYPRSGLGFRYRLQLNNTVAVIDSDYYYSDNEGHIMLKLSNDGYDGKEVSVNAGTAIAQGVFVKYCLTDNDSSNGVRNGGFGSTTK